MDLKRLTPVTNAATTAASVAGSAYASAKAYVPDKLKPTVEQAEGKVATLASPYVVYLSDKSTAALQAVDAKVTRCFPSLSASREPCARNGG